MDVFTSPRGMKGLIWGDYYFVEPIMNKYPLFSHVIPWIPSSREKSKTLYIVSANMILSDGDVREYMC